MKFKSGLKSLAVLCGATVLFANLGKAPATNNTYILYNKVQSGAEMALNLVVGNKYVNKFTGMINHGLDKAPDVAHKTVAHLKKLAETRE
jgi:hypothetical protein